jgi:hypothetical protein
MTQLHSPRGLFTAEPGNATGPLDVYVRSERIYIAGHAGTSWSVMLRNNLPGRRLLVRAGVDGKNVMRDEPFSATSGGGYVLAPMGTYPLRGWRTSDSDVREFVFTDAGHSIGRAGQQGKIVLAAVAERIPEPQPVAFATYDSDIRTRGIAPVAVAAAAAPDLGTGAGHYLADHVTRVSFDEEPGYPDMLVIRYGTMAWLRTQEPGIPEAATGYEKY